jgi:DNA-binding winged helix-turn-helix (wHTH) protein/tetratricopeptide (TPR) repeat protein
VDKSLRSTGVYVFGRFRLDAVRRTLTRDGAAVALSARVFDTLLYLVGNPGRVVPKEELINTVWAGRYVEEANLSQTVFVLRKALKDAGEEDSFITTVSGHGYRFTAPVRAEIKGPPPAAGVPPLDGAALTAAPARSGSSAEWKIRWRAVAGTAAVLFVAVLIALALNRRAASPPASSSVVALADFQNLTNDPALGTVLGKVLEIDLAQSPIVSLMSPQQVTQTLRQMERPENAVLTPALAQEVCARNQGTAMLSGAVGAIGNRYLVTLEARDCNTGKNIAQAKGEADHIEDVPGVLDALTVTIREGLNDSSASVEKFDVPIAQATTSSFEALKAFSMGERSRANGDNAGALPQFRRAVELDPSFALAYSELGSAYFGLRETELGKANFKKAFDLRNRTSENERLQIAATYYERVGNWVQAVRSYQLWTQTYPQNWLPWAHLSNVLTSVARYTESIAAGREALRLNPAHYGPYSVLARAYKRATRFADAKRIGRLATAKNLDGWDMHGILYEVAFAEGDSATMAEQVAKEKGKPTETWMLDYQAWAAATAGKLNESRALFEKAIETAREQGPDSREEVANFVEDYIETLAIFGLNQEAGKLATTATGLEDSEYAPFALAMAGDFNRAKMLATALAKRHPDSTEINDSDLPLVWAIIDLGQGKPAVAITALKPALPYEMRDFYTASLLGRAYLETNAPDKALTEFHKILSNRGVDGLSPLYPLAWLGLSRALKMQGKIPESRAAYEQLFAFWKDADGDLPILQTARNEYARLPQVVKIIH